MTPEHLSVAEAALKWHITTRPQSILIPQLIQRLTEHYAAAGGQSIPLNELAGIKQTGKRLDSFSLLNGKILSAHQILIGPLPEHIELGPTLASTLAKPPCKPRRWVMSGLPLQRPPMLDRQVILAGEHTLSLTWDQERPSPGQALVEGVSQTDHSALSTETVRQQLSSLLPFTNFKLTETAYPLAQKVIPNSFWPKGGLPKRSSSKVLSCHASHLLPSLGASADVILGQAAAGTLHKRLR